MTSLPSSRYSLWEGISTALTLAMRAIEEVRSLPAGREGAPGKDGQPGTDGRDGIDGRSIAVRSTWSAAEKYEALDIVALNGASFIARKDNPGPCPGADWQMIAAQGKRGNIGERGTQGQRGEPGHPVVAIHFNEDGLLTLTNGDGSQVSCDLYPLLSKLAR